METSVNTISKASLFKKMAAVMGELQRIPKNGFNSHFKYKFATESDVADAVRIAMAKHGLALLINMVSVERNGAIVRGVFEFTFACGETGATHTSRWEAEANDNTDKGINKLATAAEKYFLLKTFVISTGDEPDADADAPEPQVAANGYQSPKPTPIIASKPASASIEGKTVENTAALENAPQNGNGAIDVPTLMKTAYDKYKLGSTQVLAKLGVKDIREFTGTLEDALVLCNPFTATAPVATEQATLPMSTAAADMLQR